jgi:hypothetical protein
MLIDSSVARSFAAIGWIPRLLTLAGGAILIADGVHGQHPGDPSELRTIRADLQRLATEEPPGIASRALAVISGLDVLLELGSQELKILALTERELPLAVRLHSLLPEDRTWRRALGARSRRLDAGNSASIAIAAHRGLAFASDDEDALTLWHELTGNQGSRTRDLLWQLVNLGIVTEHHAQAVYRRLQTDELHPLGGPPWAGDALQPSRTMSNVADGLLLDVSDFSITSLASDDSGLDRALARILSSNTECNFNSFCSSI